MKRLYGIFVILLFGIDFIFGQSVKSDSLFHVGMEQYNEHKYELAIKTFNYVKELDILENGNEFYRNFYADWWISSSYLQMGDSAKAESISDYYDTCPIDRILVRQSDSLACLAQKYFEENNAEKALLYINESILIEKRFYHNTSSFLNSISNAIYYYVKSENEIIECKARGKFRNEDICPICGEKSVEDIPAEVYWCSHCKTPVIQTVNQPDVGTCPLCGRKAKYLR